MGCCESKNEFKKNNTEYEHQLNKGIEIYPKNQEPERTGLKGNTIKEKRIEADAMKSNKEQCKSIASSLPKRTQTDYNSFKNIIKSKTDMLSPKEKSFVLFLWICDNIAYDADAYFAGRDVDCTPEGVYRNGSSVCSGYSRLYKDIALYLNLEVECVTCYAKGVSYRVGEKMTESNHEYNVIKLNNKWYPIDSTWGAGHTEGKKYIKSYNEFFFLANPELLIKTHFPVDDKWQLTQKKYTLDEFLSWPLIKNTFYKFGFKACYPDKVTISLKNTNTQKFIIYGDNIDQKGVSCNVYLLEGNCFNQQLNQDKCSLYKDRIEIDTIFNKKGEYKVQIYGNNNRGSNYTDMLEYQVIVENNPREKLSFPTFYKGKEDINIIEPLYDNLKHGVNYKFKIESNLEEIIIIDGEWNYLKQKRNGYFEFETIINSPAGGNVSIGKRDGSTSCSSLVVYKVI